MQSMALRRWKVTTASEVKASGSLVSGTTKSYRNGFSRISKIFLGSLAQARFTKS